MNIERAQEILESEQTIPVMFNGQPVWIEEVYPISRTVRLHLTDKPDEEQTIPAELLEEQ